MGVKEGSIYIYIERERENVVVARIRSQGQVMWHL
jgi:hypothetical protein